MSILIDGTSGITPLAFSSNLQFTSTGQRILGDFSNATIANRVMFQTSVLNSDTNVIAIPNGTNNQAAFIAVNNSNPTNSSWAAIYCTSSVAVVGSSVFGSGTNLPLTFQTSNSERMRIDTSGNVGIGTSSPVAKLQVAGTSGNVQFRAGTAENGFFEINAFDNNPVYCVVSGSGSTAGVFGTQNNTPTIFFTNNTERMRIDTSGNVGINAASLGSKIFAAQGLAQSPSASGDMTTGFCFGSGTAGEALNIGTDADGVWYNSAYGNNAGVPRIHRWLTGGSERMRITSGGEVYIAGTTDQGAYNLQCNGTGVWGAGAYVNGSDARLKENITTLDDSLGLVNAMRPVTFTYKEDYSKDRSVQPGFIAQELQEVLSGKDYLDGIVQAGPEYLNVAYQNLIPLLVKSIQELTARVEELESK